ncbi:MAG: hypothetical protein ACW99G_03550 [Candidatus Thorarchaeota archaeon]|jgi:hypothetical protein
MGTVETFEEARSRVNHVSGVNSIDLSKPLKVHTNGFGDMWLRISYLINVCKAQNKTAQVCTAGGSPRNYVLNRIMNIFEDGNLITKSPNRNGPVLRMCGDFFHNCSCDTKVRWKCNSKYACYQFDGNSHSGKQMTKKEESHLLNNLRRSGYEPVNCGGNQQIDRVIKKLSNCAFFVGVASGMSLVSLSVGTPTHVVLNNVPAKTLFRHYNNRPVHYYIYASDFIRTISTSSFQRKDKSKLKWL